MCCVCAAARLPGRARAVGRRVRGGVLGVRAALVPGRGRAVVGAGAVAPARLRRHHPPGQQT